MSELSSDAQGSADVPTAEVRESTMPEEEMDGHGDMSGHGS